MTDIHTAGDSTGMTGVAKEEASRVAGGAAAAAQQVAGAAKEQITEVTAEAGRQVKGLLGTAQSQLTEQAQNGQQRAAQGLHSLADELRDMSAGSASAGAPGELAQQASEQVRRVADWLDGRDPAAVLTEVRTFARRRPAAFIAVALGAGALVGRLAKGLGAGTDDNVGNRNASTGGRRRQKPGSVGARAQRELTGDIKALPPGDSLYGTGLVPDWTGKSAADLHADTPALEHSQGVTGTQVG